MKRYVKPESRVRQLDLETSFLAGGSAGGFPVDPVDPFRSPAGWMMEEDEYE